MPSSPLDAAVGAEVVDPELEAWLRRSRQQGMLGPPAVDEHVTHALAMADALTVAPRWALDLGSGGGVPGLVLARLVWPTTQWVLLEASTRRAAFLDAAVAGLSLDPQVDVVCERAELAGQDPRFRHRFDAVLVRSFGPPAVAAECAAPLVRPGGLVVVSEPPAQPGTDRWPAAGLARLHLVVDRRVRAPFHVVVLRSVAACAPRFPRRVGIPTKRPLF